MMHQLATHGGDSAVRRLATIGLTCVLLALAACRAAQTSPYRTFAAPEEAVRALIDAAKAGKIEELVAIFGPGGQQLIDSSDPATARHNREVFTVAVAERWRLVDQGTTTKVLVIGNEEWPFPIPLVKNGNGWRFDADIGKEEIIARRIGRNELSAIRACQTYLAAQRLYAVRPHDSKRAGLYAATLRSDPGKENGLYWPAVQGQKRSPLGELLADAGSARPAKDSGDRTPPPFHGYYFRILRAQGPAAPGGARNYVVGGDMSGGHALVAWPARYDVTGVMTFVVGEDGVVREKDLGPETDAEARRISLYDPDASWRPIQ